MLHKRQHVLAECLKVKTFAFMLLFLGQSGRCPFALSLASLLSGLTAIGGILASGTLSFQR